MPDGLPIPGDTVRQTWGKGVRSGMYPISDTELYWFTVFNALRYMLHAWVVLHASKCDSKQVLQHACMLYSLSCKLPRRLCALAQP